jgi:hypothetical protein
MGDTAAGHLQAGLGANCHLLSAPSNSNESKDFLPWPEAPGLLQKHLIIDATPVPFIEEIRPHSRPTGLILAKCQAGLSRKRQTVCYRRKVTEA